MYIHHKNNTSFSFDNVNSCKDLNVDSVLPVGEHLFNLEGEER